MFTVLRSAQRNARAFSTSRRILNAGYTSTKQSALETKYAEKLKAKMNEKGVESLEQLKELSPKPKVEPLGVPRKDNVSPAPAALASGSTSASSPAWASSERKDSSPVKPLSSFFNVSRIMATPHTADQISSLWLVYHGSRSNGTGRGYLSASMSRTQYDSMLARAKKYPIFIIPLQHTVPVEGGVEGETKEATEFYFLQWDLHEPPEVPSANTVDPAMGVDALLASKTSSSSSASEPASGSATRAPPHISTVILTPLQEYKLRSTYAQPRLVLTHYSNFANTHDTVLLRGEIAESSSSSGNYMLSQVEAQLLALAVQRFYLAVDEGQGKEVSGKAFQLLQDFHQRPESFDYEKLIELSPRI